MNLTIRRCAGFLGLIVLGGCTGVLSSTEPDGDDIDGLLDPDRPTGSGAPGEPVAGGFWAAQCESCHGTFGGSSSISTGNANGDFRLDAQAAIAEHSAELEAYIADTMPLSDPSLCEGECAKVTGEYIRSRVIAGPDLTACATQEGLRYGERSFKLLTSGEYQNSLEDLLGVETDFGSTVSNNDGTVGGFSNMAARSLNDATLETYTANAEAIADWASSRDQPFSCGNASQCGQRFVDEFLFKAFRGEVPSEQRSAYLELFDTYGVDAMPLALEAALTSPHFLYRTEVGVDRETALAAGYYTGGDGQGSEPPPPPPSGSSETIDAIEFPPGSGGLDGDSWLFTENGFLELEFENPLGDPASVEVEARGTSHGSIWPELELLVNGSRIDSQSIDAESFSTFRFDVAGAGAATRIRLEFNNDSGEAPYGPGQDANLYIRRVTVTGSGAATASTQTSSANLVADGLLSELADDAFVLSPNEFATAMSFMLTGSTPDDALLRAAQADELTSPAQIRAQVERLIDSPRGRDHVGKFVNEWFRLDRVRSASRPDVNDFTPQVRNAMVREVQEHFKHVFYDASAPFHEFYDGDYTFVNDTLASFYGIPGDFSAGFVKTETTERGGPIASGAFMAANAHVERTAPILRAVRSREAALCQHVDPPNSPLAGDDIDAQRAAAQERVEARAAEGALSSREFYYLYTDGISACAGCHETVINPNFGMEDFDNVGRLRPMAGPGEVYETIDGEQTTVSLEGKLIGVESIVDGQEIDYQGAKDFSNQIAATNAVQSCLVQRSFRFLTGLPISDRELDTSVREELREKQRLDHACTEAELNAVLADTGESPRDIFVQLALSDLMRFRR